MNHENYDLIGRLYADYCARRRALDAEFSALLIDLTDGTVSVDWSRMPLWMEGQGND